ncbi:fused NTPase and glycosyl transferase [Amycolatopsis mediterranei S699]|uniref:Fused NTPase and glycosyltransferase n=3 Tax=Amycolatopsis mediterranei TaxID=33910 RepID=A0A0H3D656_AMYMU|nr:helix-turn-helix domain-containing protein [Amycolatopsis mediterranei]ADJ46106.1 fused NTPase and glycosyltransferase [Amycolatopsis mediterranei U32]AEK42892.1 fused NTPase and glycosyl transferase [Amycolatopsis mediterranei S699]AFO77818.1 fused NTPase and glycosyl transferase [Amycolatopsis mediterranei S699]AGT84946.1 fused NTPase and glycosyl transferase [Amycolatopsis mediterranei RB]KDO05641.1 NTPase [Amycolatopsis mediterranei]
MGEEWEPFGSKIRELRLRAGLSTKALGDLIHYSKAQVSRVEQGQSPPTTTFAAACDRVFGTGDELAKVAARRAVGDRRMTAEPKFDLPAGPSRLIGRDAEVEALTDHLKEVGGRQAAQVCVLHGLPGVGKTSIALWVADALRDDYPDGRLYLDMQGYHPDSKPVSEEEALDRILRRLGVPGELVPRNTDDRAALLRQKLVNRRVLLILDSVKGARELARLLPPNGRSAVIVTSRQPLTALGPSFHQQVRTLAPAAAAELFRSVAQLPQGSDERGDRAVITEITRMCYQLPLAICIVASRFRDNPVRRLEDVAARLADEAARPREFDDGERSITAVFAASCATLSDGQQAMLAMTALHPGPRIDAYAAGALAGIAPAAAEELLDGLIRSGMLEWHSHNAYRLHDMLRDHLRRPETGILSEGEAVAGRRRLFEYFLHTAAAANKRANEHRYRIPLDPPSAPVTSPLFPDPEAGKKWLDLEADNFLPLLQEMAGHGHDVECWKFAYNLREYFYATKQWELMIACFEKAHESAVRTEDHKAMGVTLNGCGLARGQLGERDAAMDLYERARAEFVAAEDRHGEMNVVANHAWLAFESGDCQSAAELAGTAWRFYCDVHQRFNAAIALDLIARCQLRLGLLAEAEQRFREALDEFVDLGFRDGDVAQLLSYLGETELKLGKVAIAGDRYRKAVERARYGGATREEAVAFEGLSVVAAAIGDVVDAAAHRAAAIALYEEAGATAEVERLRAEGPVQAPADQAAVQPDGGRERVRTSSRRRLRVLAVNTEWESRNGGLSTFNRELCRALAAEDVEVYCSIPFASEEERRDAAATGVILVHPPAALDRPEKALSRPPLLLDGVVPDIVIGHGRKTGEPALWLVEDHYRDAKLLHFFHVIADRVELEKEYEPDEDPAEEAEKRFRAEFAIASKAHLAVGVGPVLHHYLRDRLHGTVNTASLRLDPGFDAVEPPAELPPPSDTVRVLLVGRLTRREAKLKGVDLLARALGHACRQRGSRDPEVELVLRGVEAKEGKPLADAVRSWAESPSLRVVPRPYSPSVSTLAQDLRQASVVVMPSRTEGFGLVGLEAITAGVPAIVSNRSGLGALLEEERGELSVELTSRVLPVDDDERVDTLRWGDALAAVLNNPKPAFATARALREEMSAKRTWAMAAKKLVESMHSLVRFTP